MRLRYRFARSLLSSLITALLLSVFACPWSNPVLGSHTDQHLFDRASQRLSPPSIKSPLENMVGSTVVRIDYVVLSEMVLRDPEALRNSETLVVSLFTDIEIIAARERARTKPDGRISWVGRPVADDGGRVLLSLKDGRLIGNVTYKGKKYEIQHLGQGVHAVAELGEAYFLEEDCPEHGPSRDYAEPDSARVLGAIPPPKKMDTGDFVDALVVYTADAAAGAGNINDLIAQSENDANDSYARSGIDFELRVVHTAQVTYTESHDAETDVDRLADPVT